MKNDTELFIKETVLNSIKNNNHTLEDIKILTKELENLELVDSTTSILNVPLFQSPVLKLSDLTKQINTINTNKNIDKTLVKQEFLSSPLYQNQLVSKDFKTTAIIINIKKLAISIAPLKKI